MSLWLVKQGDEVIIKNANGSILYVRKVHYTTDTRIVVNGGVPFSRTTGKEIGGSRVCSCAEPEVIAEAEAILARQRIEKEAEEERNRQVAYDALPESAKLYRKLSFAIDAYNEAAWADAPIESMRSLVAWCELKNLKTD